MTSLDGARRAHRRARSAGEFALKVIPDHWSAMRARLSASHSRTGRDRHATCPSVTKGPTRGAICSMRQVQPCRSPRRRTRAAQAAARGSSVRKVGHDLKFDLIVLANHGIALRGVEFDSMLGSYLLDATRSGHPIEDGRARAARLSGADRGGRLRQGATRTADGAALSGDGSQFCGRARRSCLAVVARAAALISEAQLDSVLRELEMPLMPVLADIERAGILIDGPALAARSRQIEQELAGYTARIYELAGEEFNINSPPQLGRDPVREARSAVGEENRQDALVFDGRRGARGTGAHARTAAARPRVAGVPQVEEHIHRRAAVHGRPETGRVHTSFNQAVAATGRLSSSDPNLQNIPIRTELGREIRRAFVAGAGMC